MKPLDRYLDSIREKIEAEARAEATENGGHMDEYIDDIRDAYAEGFCDDRQAQEVGDYPYDGSLDQGDPLADWYDTRAELS